MAARTLLLVESSSDSERVRWCLQLVSSQASYVNRISDCLSDRAANIVEFGAASEPSACLALQRNIRQFVLAT